MDNLLAILEHIISSVQFLEESSKTVTDSLFNLMDSAPNS